jgi:hypothetical protein
MAPASKIENTGSSAFEEELAQVAAQDSRAMVEAAELERMYQLEEQRNQDRQRKVNLAKQVVANEAKQMLRKEAAALGKQAAKTAWATATRAFTVWVAPWLGGAALIVGVILFLLIGGILAVDYQCNKQGMVESWGTRFVSNLAFEAGYLPLDACKELNALKGVNPIGSGELAGTITGSLEGDAEAREYLSFFDITVNKPCIDPEQSLDQTCLDGVLQSTLNEIGRLKTQCNAWVQSSNPAAACDIVVTGGTEEGHATSAECVHEAGYKIDLRLLPDTLDAFIAANYTPMSPRGGDPRWHYAPSNSYYVKEADHWDVSVGCA